MGIKIGDKVGSYRVLRPLGQGGMGTVFEVEHERLGVHFALKAFTLAFGANSVINLKQRLLL